jgi:hypothetical protein
MDPIDQIAEEKIAQAMARGEFDDLPGAGSPLRLDDDTHVPPELRVAWRILKNAGCLPPEIALRREIREVEQLLAASLDRAQRDIAGRRLGVLLGRLAAARGGERDLRIEQDYHERLRKRFARRGS